MFNHNNYYMAVSYKDWELPNSQIWLVEINITSGPDFLIQTSILTGYILQWTNCKNIDYFLLTTFICGGAKKPHEKKSIEDEQTLAELSLAHCFSQEKCQLVQTSYIKRINSFLFAT